MTLTPRTIRLWAWLHKWSSLVCTLFMLLLCLTGLPLIFHHEIGHLTGTEIEAPPLQAELETRRASADEVMAAARARYPDRIVQFMGKSDDDERLWWATLTPTPAPTESVRSTLRYSTLLDATRRYSGVAWSLGFDVAFATAVHTA